MAICMQVAALQARDAALQQALAERNIDNVELRRQLAAARQAADPHIAQARLPATLAALRVHVGLVCSCGCLRSAALHSAGSRLWCGFRCLQL